MEPPYNIQDPERVEADYKVYKRRWYILFIFSTYAFTESAVWNTWGPISTTSENAFNWTDSTIALMNNWGPIPYVLTGFFFPWLLQVKGLKWATVTSMFCVAAGTAFRVITSEPKTATILIHVGQFLNGVGGPISTGAIPAVSAIWFSPTERVAATALSNSINSFGTAVAFILGPALVPETHSNKTKSPHKFLLFQDLYVKSDTLELDNKTLAVKALEREQIMRYMYYVCGWSCLLFVVILCYFPAKPPLPPCLSATVERQHYWADIWSLRKRGSFLIITQLYGVSLGVFGGWISVLNINLSTIEVGEETAGWMGFYSTVAGCVGSLLVGRFAGSFVRYIKVFILIAYTLATASLTVFALMLIKVVPPSIIGLYVTIIAANTTINIAVPLFFELACELAYPTSEGSANGVLTLFSNFWSLVFLFVFSIPDVGSMWMNWAVISTTAACIPLLLIIKGRFNRLEVDENLHTERYTENVVVVPDVYTEDDPLLDHDDTVQYGIHNSGDRNQPLPSHAELRVNAVEINGFTNPILTDDMHLQTSPDLTHPQNCVIQNPVPTDISHGNLVINTEYGIQNPSSTDSANTSNESPDSTNPQKCGIRNATFQDVTMLSDVDEKLPEEYRTEDSLLGD
ncbi:hypothetical protein BsWGS_09415 [Bradybaena similaris]